MEIRTTNSNYIGTDREVGINRAMDAIVCALILECYHVKTIRDALLGKAEAMIHEFYLKEK